MAELATFKSPSKIEFSVSVPPKVRKPLLSETKRGETFLWEADHGRHAAAICMRASVSGYHGMTDLIGDALRAAIEKIFKDCIWITNLQTGRTFIAKDCEIEYVKVRVIVEGA